MSAEEPDSPLHTEDTPQAYNPFFDNLEDEESPAQHEGT